MSLIHKIIIFFKEFLKILIITFCLILSLDFIFGDKILKLIDPYIKETEFYDKRVRIWDKTFHHTFKANTNIKSVGIEKNNRFCTNHLGFKSDCNSQKIKNYKFGFLGDSFTEGIGLNHENTFVGLFEKKLGFEVANLGVSSYSPKLHLAKLNHFLNQEINFEHIVLFLDISDYYDEAFYSFDNNDLSVIHNSKDRRRIWLKDNFPFTNYYFYVLKKIRKSSIPEIEIPNRNSKLVFDESVMRKTSWLKENMNSFEINNKTVLEIHNETKSYVDKIYKILNDKNINFSLAIYPWPQNCVDNKNNEFYRNEWKNFCKLRCDHFFDYFQDFDKKNQLLGYEEVYKTYYIWGDVHFNKKGNIFLANKIIKNLIEK